MAASEVTAYLESTGLEKELADCVNQVVREKAPDALGRLSELLAAKVGIHFHVFLVAETLFIFEVFFIIHLCRDRLAKNIFKSCLKCGHKVLNINSSCAGAFVSKLSVHF